MTAAQMAHDLKEMQDVDLVAKWVGSLGCTYSDGHEDTQSKGQRLEGAILWLRAGATGEKVQYQIANELADKRLPQAQLLGLELIEAQRVLELAHLLQMPIGQTMTRCKTQTEAGAY